MYSSIDIVLVFTLFSVLEEAVAKMGYVVAQGLTHTVLGNAHLLCSTALIVAHVGPW
jgi:hypothetical protein